MSNIIQFLESMGKDPVLGGMSQQEYTAAVKALNVDDVAELALLHRDHQALNNSLGGRIKMMMMLAPAEDDDQAEEKEGDKDGGHKQEEEISVN